MLSHTRTTPHNHVPVWSPATWRDPMIRASRLLAVLATAGLVACGGGSDAPANTTETLPPEAALSISGVAAVGAPLAQASVQVRCSTGTPASTTTLPDGSYSLRMVGAALPCALRASGGTVGSVTNAQVLHAWLPGPAGSTSARANLTPLTELMAAQLAGGDPAAFFDALDASTFAQITTAATATALDAVRTGLPEALRSALGSTDPLTAVFQANGTGLDAVLDQLKDALAAAGVTLDEATARVAQGSAPLPPYLSGPAAGTGQAGDSVTLNGHALPATPVVRFGSTTATGAVTNASGTQITVPVPAGLAAGMTSLTVEGVTGAVAYTVVVPPPPGPDAPVLSGFSPASGPAGTVITVTGSGFASGQVVKFGDAVVAPTALSATSFTFAVPPGLVDASYAIRVADVTAVQAFVLSTPVPPPPGTPAGTDWTQITGLPLTINTCNGTYTGVARSGTTWVAVGQNACVRTSADGLNWTEGTQVFAGFNFLDLLYANGRFVAVGSGGNISTSTDGSTWTTPSVTAVKVAINSLVWTGSRFVAVGDAFGGTDRGVNLYTSTDGQNWTAGKVSSDPLVSLNSLKLTSVAANGNTLVAVGGATTNCVAWRSTDGGTTWSSIGSDCTTNDGKFILGPGIGEASARGVAYGNGRWVAVGAMGDYALSTDNGLTWSTGKVDPGVPLGTLVALNRVFFDGTQFVTVGNQKRIYTSADGQTWTRRFADTTLASSSIPGQFRGIGGSGGGRLVVTGTANASGFMTSTAH